jgi:hypothetical protein
MVPQSISNAGADIMPCPGCYNYYGYYYNNIDYDMFEDTSYKTGMDDQGYYSYYTRGEYTLYQSYYYNGLSTSESFDGSSGQTCTYQSVYKYWSLYGSTTYNCSRASKKFVM